ncbi:MAG TPA: anthranilate phosphoribosyltransferase [Acidisarcina sp.]
MSNFDLILRKVSEERLTLTREQARTAVEAMLAAPADDAEAVSDIKIAALLTALATRGETADELTGFVDGMRAMALPLPLTHAERAALVDTCGTGGVRLGTFNISTGAALVAAAAGAKVAKHGNRGVTSRCGSADVLEALGIAVSLPPRAAVECLRATNFMFLFAPAMHPAMRRVQPVRKALGFRTIFNLAGPLTNPARAGAQVMGVFARDRVAIVAEAMAKLGVRHAFVVHGLDGLDELTLAGESEVAEVRGANAHCSSAPDHFEGSDLPGTVRLFQMNPEDVGLQRSSVREPLGGDAAGNAAILEAIFAGERGPRRDVVLLNASAALVAAGIARDFKEGLSRAAEVVDSGAARATLALLRAFSNEHAMRSS